MAQAPPAAGSTAVVGPPMWRTYSGNAGCSQEPSRQSPSRLAFSGGYVARASGAGTPGAPLPLGFSGGGRLAGAPAGNSGASTVQMPMQMNFASGCQSSSTLPSAASVEGEAAHAGWLGGCRSASSGGLMRPGSIDHCSTVSSVAAASMAAEAVKAALGRGTAQQQQQLPPPAPDFAETEASTGASAAQLEVPVGTNSSVATIPLPPGVPTVAPPATWLDKASGCAGASQACPVSASAGQATPVGQLIQGDDSATTPCKRIAFFGQKGDGSECDDSMAREVSGVCSTPTPARGVSSAGKLPPKRRITPPIPGVGSGAAGEATVETTECKSPSHENLQQAREGGGDPIIMRKLREVFDRCDSEGTGRVSKRKLIQTLRNNAWMAGLFKLPRECDLEGSASRFSDSSGEGSDIMCDEVTWTEFAAQVSQWPRMPSKLAMPSGAQHRSQTPSRSPPVPTLSSQSSQAVASDPTIVQNPGSGDPEPPSVRFANWTERQTAQHLQARSWLLAQALMLGGAPQAITAQGAQQSQLRALARDVDAQVLCAAATPSPGGGAPSVEARMAVVLPYVELLRGDGLQDIAHHNSAGEALSPSEACQAEAAVRACIVQLERALVARLTVLMDEARGHPEGSSAATTTCMSSRGASTPQQPLPGMAFGAAAKVRISRHA